MELRLLGFTVPAKSRVSVARGWVNGVGMSRTCQYHARCMQGFRLQGLFHSMLLLKLLKGFKASDISLLVGFIGA